MWGLAVLDEIWMRTKQILFFYTLEQIPMIAIIHPDRYNPRKTITFLLPPLQSSYHLPLRMSHFQEEHLEFLAQILLILCITTYLCSVIYHTWDKGEHTSILMCFGSISIYDISRVYIFWEFQWFWQHFSNFINIKRGITIERHPLGQLTNVGISYGNRLVLVSWELVTLEWIYFLEESRFRLTPVGCSCSCFPSWT